MVVVVALVVGGLLLSAGVRLLSAGGLLLRGPYFLWGPYFLEVFSLLQEIGATYRRKRYIFGIREAKRLF